MTSTPARLLGAGVTPPAAVTGGGSRRRPAAATALAGMVCCLAAAAAAPAQVEVRTSPAGRRQPDFRDPFDPTRSQRQDPTRYVLQLDPVERQFGVLPPGYPGLEEAMPLFQGFPTFPPDVPGYGGYPGVRLPVPFTAGVTVPPRPRDAAPLPDDAWPSWFGPGEAIGDEGFTAERAVLHRGSDRVWYHGPRDTAFVPLAFWDKFRVLSAGSRIEVRHKGEYQITFHGGAMLRAHRPSRLEVEVLNEEIIALRLPHLSKIWLSAVTRPVRLTLPDESVLEAQGTSAYLERGDGFARISNDGVGRLVVRGAIGQQEIPPGHSVWLPLLPTTRSVIGAALALEGDVDARRDGRVLAADGGARGGTVTWNGARFAVPAGGNLRLDPLGGDEFPDNRAKER